ncbi:MAG TPA: AAA family ATPase [Gemmatimonadales bacterium]
MISCQTLGPVGLSLDGGPAPPELLWRKHLGLLIYLARSPRGRTREHLVGLLWPDKPEAAARHSLNEGIRVLRRYLGDSSVDTAAGQVRLAPEAVRLDVDRLEELARGGDWPAAARLIAGEFLEGFAIPDASGFEDWLAGERSSIRRRSIELLLNYGEELLQSGKAGQASAMAMRALALEPRSEPALRLAMRSTVLAGDRAAALELYQTFRARLVEEMGSLPDAATEALVDRVRQERALRPAPAGRTGDRLEEPRPPLVGREVELANLVGAAAVACRERRAVALILQGDSGTGKTRLAEELLARLRLEGLSVAAMRAVQADRGEEWSGVLAVARGGLLQAAGIAAAPAGALGMFAEAIPEWADRFRGSRREPGALSYGRALSEVLRAATEEQPLVVAVDDAQWLDQASLLALLAALRDLVAAPLILLLTADLQPPRPELEELRTRLGRDFRGTVLRLGPLHSADLRALARHMLPRFDEVEIERVVRRVATDSAGLPLLAVELLRAVALGLDLRGTAGAWPEPLKTLDQTLPGDLPDTISAAIRVGFRRLSPTAQHALSVASVLGDRVPLERLAQALGLPLREVAAALDELEWHRWLLCDTRGYTFVARVVQQVVARDMLTPGQRQRIQAMISAHPGTPSPAS